ncbi:T9SS type A sorting domain-containing protein [Flavobacterium sp.]|uniref:T9SS type A sorting domain-containing protein n=1 Tax=Flavobacterium sp. TaxID=239 RepID=UPI002BA58346|nr:T9SS type A sorting domain-containing protein [Flavobacterium sp.]HQA73059.1 T9SS type A sorting domain-containing protein [Flavobacterium sp.]
MKKILLSLSFLLAGFATNAQSWVEQASGFNDASRGISQFSIVNANTVWALAYNGADTTVNIQEFTKTTDGGANWSPGIIDLGDSLLEINNIIAVDETNAWVSALIPADGNGVVFRTYDGGLNWIQQNSLGFQTSGESFINGVHFFDANNGLSYGDPEGGEFEMYTTTDGGENWTRVPGANIPNPLSGEYGYNGGNVFVGSTCFLVTNKGRILKSTDMGLTWSVSQAPVTDFGSAAQSARLSFSSATNGCMLKTIGTNYTFYTTTNGGTSWSAGTPFTGLYRVLTYVPGTNTIVATSAATAASGSAYSSDNGVTWTSIDSGAQRGIAAFFNGSTGWCAGFNQDASTGGVFKLSGTLSNNQFTSTKFSVYPNPSSSNITISSELDSYKLRVIDVTGKVMINKELNGLENNIDVSSFSNGLYFFEINAGNNTETIKIIKN